MGKETSKRPDIDEGVSKMFNIVSRFIEKNPDLYDRCDTNIDSEVMAMGIAVISGLDGKEATPEVKRYAKAAIVKLHMEIVLKEMAHRLKL